MLSYMKPPFGGGGDPRGSAGSLVPRELLATLGRSRVTRSPCGALREDPHRPYGLAALISSPHLLAIARPCGLSILRSARSSGAHPAPPLFAGLTSLSECPKSSAKCRTQESMHLGHQIYRYIRMPEKGLFMPKSENWMYTHSHHYDDSQCTFGE